MFAVFAAITIIAVFTIAVFAAAFTIIAFIAVFTIAFIAIIADRLLSAAARSAREKLGLEGAT